MAVQVLKTGFMSETEAASSWRRPNHIDYGSDKIVQTEALSYHFFDTGVFCHFLRFLHGYVPNLN